MRTRSRALRERCSRDLHRRTRDSLCTATFLFQDCYSELLPNLWRFSLPPPIHPAPSYKGKVRLHWRHLPTSISSLDMFILSMRHSVAVLPTAITSYLGRF